MPRLEPLEGRVVLTLLPVVSALDSGGSGTLRDEIAKAQTGDIIVFAPALQGQTIHLTGQALKITKSLSILGPIQGPITVDAGGLSGVFSIAALSGPVTISNLTISGGWTAVGGGIYDFETGLTLNNDLLTQNQAAGLHPGDSAYGGGVALLGPGASLTASGAQFIWNKAEGADGSADPKSNGQGGDALGGAILAGPGTSLSLSGCIFKNNLATGGRGGSGGAGSTWNRGGAGYGGAIDTFASSFSASNCNFSGDAAQGGWGSTNPGPANSSSNAGGPAIGGAVAVAGSFATSLGFGPMGVTAQAVAVPPTLTLAFTSDTFTHETAQAGRGGVDWDMGGNLANGGGGPAFGGAIGDLSLVEDLQITSCTFTSGQALGGRGAGGASLVGGAGGPAVGAAIATMGNLTVTGATTFSGNTALGGAGGDVSEEGPGGPVYGGTVFTNGALSVSGATFSGNVARGGDAGLGFSAPLGVGGSVIGGVVDAQAWGAAGGGQVVGPAPSSNIASSQFQGNTSTGGRGGATIGDQRTVAGAGGDVWGGDLCAFGNIWLSGTTLTGERATGGLGGTGLTAVNSHTGATGGAGGAVRGGSLALLNNPINGAASGGIASLMNVNVMNTAAQGGNGGTGHAGGRGGAVDGGGLYIAAGPGAPKAWVVASFSGGQIVGDVAQGGQGGGTTGGPAGVGAGALGGGLFVDYASTVAIDSSFIQSNQANGGFAADGSSRGLGLGGGVYLTGLGSTRKNTTISGNSASTLDNDVYGTFS